MSGLYLTKIVCVCFSYSVSANIQYVSVIKQSVRDSTVCVCHIQGGPATQSQCLLLAHFFFCNLDLTNSLLEIAVITNVIFLFLVLLMCLFFLLPLLLLLLLLLVFTFFLITSFSKIQFIFYHSANRAGLKQSRERLQPES